MAQDLKQQTENINAKIKEAKSIMGEQGQSSV
jgi:hypothetical protein